MVGKNGFPVNMQEICVSGQEALPYLEKLGQLRIVVFYDFPYLYEGDLNYERDYLRIYTEHPESIVFGLEAEDRWIGATTGMPLICEAKNIQKPFIDVGIPLTDVFYFGESVLLSEFRGQGFGHRFFDVREAHALKNGYKITAFCSVERPETHPLKPEDYRPNDDFWHKRGYVKHPELTCEMSWLDRGETEETSKTLTFWLKKWQ